MKTIKLFLQNLKFYAPLMLGIYATGWLFSTIIGFIGPLKFCLFGVLLLSAISTIRGEKPND